VRETGVAPRARTLVRVAFLLVAGAAVVLAVVHQGPDLRHALSQLGVGALLLSQLATLLGLLASALCWRAGLAALGHPLALRPSLHVFFVGQLGKYLPGNVFALAAQAELARDHRVPRSRVFVAGLLFLGVLTTTGVLLAAATLPFTSPGALRTYAWVLPALPLGLALLVPAVLERVVGLALRVTRRAPLDAPLDRRALLVAVGWSLAMWLLYGAHVLPLVHALHGGDLGEAAVTGTGAYALAWTAGFLFVVAPAGAVVREAVLVLALGGLLSHADGTAVALASRGVQTLGDLLLALAFLGPRKRAGTVDA
jgi:hypothetical protein